MKSDLVDLKLAVMHETPAAYRVSDDGIRSMWLPKSQCERGDRVGTTGGCPIHEFTMPEWLAIEKELV